MGSAITPTAGANAGGSPPTPTMGASSVDWRGSVNFGTGTSAAAGAQVILKTGVPWTGNSVTAVAGLQITLTPLNAATAALGPWYMTTNSDGRTFTVCCTGTPTSSQSTGTYVISYGISGT